jgi:AcrR family transcriptional regulator
MAAAAPLPPARRLRKGEATAARILDAAEGLFAERGYAGTTLRDVAARAGLRIPSLYNHFRSKEALYAAVLARGFGPVLEVLAEFVAAPERRGSESSGVLVERVMDLLARHPTLPRLLLHETAAGGSRLSAVLRDWIAPAFARAQALVESTPTTRPWPAELVPMLVLAMYHAVVGYFAIAPLYRDLTGSDLLAETARARQTELLRRMVDALFPATEAAPPRG